MDKLLAPALTGKFGTWRYYQFVLKVKDFACNHGTLSKPQYRIKSVDEVEEIYSKNGVSNLLQRVYNPKRLTPIKNYLLNQPDRYINNLTVGIFGGSPDWIDLEITSTNNDLPADRIPIVAAQIGLISFDGSETLFVLDGQHRLKGLRSAFIEKPEVVEDDDVVCTLIIHSATDKGRQRTRRLFSTINRQAVPVSKGENILLDEDDVSAIVTRAMIEDYPRFKGKEIITLSKSANIGKSKDEQKCLTSVVTLYSINEALLDHKEIYPKIDGKLVRIRPQDKTTISNATNKVFHYWDLFFSVFPEAEDFITLPSEKRIELRKAGGPICLRPIVQLAVFEILAEQKSSHMITVKRLQTLPKEVSHPFWHYIAWDPIKNTMLFNRSLVRVFIKYKTGMLISERERKGLATNYFKNSGKKLEP